MAIRGALAALIVGTISLGAPDRLADEFARLAAEIPKVVPGDSSGAILQRLERGRKALESRQLYLALYDLQPAFEAEGGYRQAATSVTDHDAFTKTWMQMGEPKAPSTGKARVAFIEALAQSAAGRAPATYRASRPYAEDAGLTAGLYYLGEAHAMVRFAALCRSLDIAASAPPPRFRSIEPMLAAYEREVVEAYDAADAAKRPQYAGVNVAIKLARTLDEQGQHEGALLQYLVSRYRFRVVRSTSEPADLEQLKARVAAVPLPPGADHSIAEFFLQLAAATVAARDPAGAGAAAVIDDILPAYLEVVGK
jgi:hypothetical protein